MIRKEAKDIQSGDILFNRITGERIGMARDDAENGYIVSVLLYVNDVGAEIISVYAKDDTFDVVPWFPSGAW